MGSTFWVVLYFRLLKRDKVINQLTKYLLQYRTVSIPHVGTFQIMQHSPQLDVVHKIIQPPSFAVELKEEENITEHQLNFLADSLREEKETIQHSLEELGHNLSVKVQQEGFDWKGIGMIRQGNDGLTIPTNSLVPVPAERVAREDVEHKVLVGNQEMLVSATNETMPEESKGRKKYSLYIILGWIILLLAILYIVFVLFTGKFSIHSTGSKQSVEQVSRQAMKYLNM